MATRPIRLRTISPWESAKPTRIDAIPNLAFEQPAGNDRLIPQRVGWIAILGQTPFSLDTHGYAKHLA
jgi:hypothetical protein